MVQHRREHSLYSTVNSRFPRLQGASKWYVNRWWLHPWPECRPCCPPRTPQTPLKHYPRADALGKSDATILPSWRIDITSRHHRFLLYPASYLCMHSNLHFVVAACWLTTFSACVGLSQLFSLLFLFKGEKAYQLMSGFLFSKNTKAYRVASKFFSFQCESSLKAM